MTIWNQHFGYTICVSKIELRPFIELYCFLSIIQKTKQWLANPLIPLIWGTYITMINAYGFGFRCLLGLTRLLNYLLISTYRLFTFWSIKILFVHFQNRNFFAVIRKYPEVINPNWNQLFQKYRLKFQSNKLNIRLYFDVNKI